MAVKVIPASGAGAGVTGSLWAARISGNTLGTTALINSGTLSLNAGTNITLSQSATNKITILGPTNIVSAAVIGGNTSGVTASISSGTMNIFGGNNVTLSQNANSITVSGKADATLSLWAPWVNGAMNASTMGNGTLFMMPAALEKNLTATQANFAISGSFSSVAGSSHAGTISFAVGWYTKNASTLSLASAGSATYAWTNTDGDSTGSLTGGRIVSVPININASPGNYWLGFLSNTSTAGNAFYTMSVIVGNGVAISGSFLSPTNATQGSLAPGIGLWSASTNAMPASVGFSDLNNTNNARVYLKPYMYFMNYSV